VALLLVGGSAKAEETQQYGSFLYIPSVPKLLSLAGPITNRDALQFKRALREHPEIAVVQLFSPGGDMTAGLLIAEDVFDKGISTYIPPDFTCASACSFIFLAGKARLVEGKLGVHQFYADSGELSGSQAQYGMADIISTIVKFGISSEILTTMLNTPPTDMHYFTPTEIEKYQINRTSIPTSTQPQVNADTDRMQDRAKFVTRNLIYGNQQPLTEILGNVLKYYAPEVEYFGKLTTKDKLIDDKRNYAQRWENRVYMLKDESVTAVCRAETCVVSGIYDYSLTSPKRHKNASGRAAFVYGMALGEAPQILIENGKVLRKSSGRSRLATESISDWLNSMQ
jgi:hypothetical protein